ncbi:MAG: exodeoxyribonuclease VII large subunit [Clostridia bacterium]|nr:exodeoxyribonuclease VII large subunit [Clostridia bacterium]
MESVSPKVYTVSTLNNYIKDMIDSDITLRELFIVGEISNFKAHSSGHMYMTLKDEKSAIKAVMFKGNASRLKFMPADGMSVIVFGSVSVFQRDGQYQLYIQNMQPDGIGSLTLAFEQLKEKLMKEGLFAAEHKKTLPRYPKTVGVVTSDTAAAFEDIKNVLKRRWPMADILLSPTKVQGEAAVPEIIKAITSLDESGRADVIILARGGGSIEDLWCFNDERVARTIYSCKTPLITGVGHEIDYTIADFVADYRAPTPSAAAEVSVPDIRTELSDISKMRLHIQRTVTNMLNSYKDSLDFIRSKNVLKSPLGLIDERRLILDGYSDRMSSCMTSVFTAQKNRFELEMRRLDAFSPLKVLGRGYAIAEKDGRVIKSINDVSLSDDISLKVADGKISCKVIDKKNDKE